MTISIRQALPWAQAIRIVDQSELPLRDIIERELSGVAGTRGLTLGEAMRVADRVMERIQRLRVAAIRAAFRHIRDNPS